MFCSQERMGQDSGFLHTQNLGRHASFPEGRLKVAQHLFPRRTHMRVISVDSQTILVL